MSFSRLRFDHYARELSLAIYDLSLESRESVFLALKQDLRNVVEYGRPNSKPHLELGFQRYSFVGEPSIETEEDPLTSAIDRIKAKALQARGIAPQAIRDFESDLDGIIGEREVLAKKRAAAVAPHKEVIAGIYGEFDGLHAAMDLLSNGGPSLDPLEESEPVSPVSTTEPQA